MKAIYIGIVLLVGGILAGCSGSSGTTAASTPAPAKVTITSSNEGAVTKSAISAATQSLGSSFAASVGGVQTTTDSSNDRILFNAADFALQKMAQQQNAPASVIGAVTTTACKVSGNFVEDTDGAATTATYYKVTFNNCVEVAGTTYNGTIFITGVSRTTNSLTATLAFDFSVVSNGSTTVSLVGGFTISETGVGTATQINTLSGTSFVLSASSGSFSLTGAAGTSGFNFTDTFNNNATTPVVHSNDINFAVAVTDKVTTTNSFAFSALTTTGKPLVKSSADTYLRSGQIVVTGDASTALKVTIDGTSAAAGTISGPLTIELSTDGGKTWGTATPKTWGTL